VARRKSLEEAARGHGGVEDGGAAAALERVQGAFKRSEVAAA
jgi:hypothetical protein